MSTPYSINGSLNYPADATLPADQVPIAASGSFGHEASAVLNLTGAGTKVVDMGTIPAAGAKAVLVKVDAGASVTPITVAINGGSQPVQVSAGGFILISNPSPTAGITALTITHTSSCVVRVWALG